MRCHRTADPTKPASPENPILQTTSKTEVIYDFMPLYVDTGGEYLYDITNIFHRTVKHEVKKQLSELKHALSGTLAVLNQTEEEIENWRQPL